MGKMKERKEYKVYLSEDETEYLKSFLETTRNKGGLSGVLNSYVLTMANTLKASGYEPGEKVTPSRLIKIFKQGLAMDLAK